MPLTILFWNIGQRRTVAWDPLGSLIGLVERFEVDVLALAEPKKTLLRVQAAQPRHRLWRQISSTRDKVGVASHHSPERLRRLASDPSERAALYEIEGLRLCFLHLSDPRNHPLADRNANASRVAEWFRTASEGAPTALLGDFNLDPYDEGLVSSTGFHAVPTSNLAKRGSRLVSGERRPLLYNPTWSYLGDRPEGLAGSFGGRLKGAVSPGWHAFDQLLLTPDLVERVDWSRTGWRTASGESSAPSRHRPHHDGSDHYALLLRLQ